MNILIAIVTAVLQAFFGKRPERTVTDFKADPAVKKAFADTVKRTWGSRCSA